MPEITELLKEIHQDLKDIKQNKTFPRFLSVKEIAEHYHIAPSKVREICREYGTDFGGLGIEEEVLKKVLQAEGKNLLKGVWSANEQTRKTSLQTRC